MSLDDLLGNLQADLRNDLSGVLKRQQRRLSAFGTNNPSPSGDIPFFPKGLRIGRPVYADLGAGTRVGVMGSYFDNGGGLTVGPPMPSPAFDNSPLQVVGADLLTLATTFFIQCRLSTHPGEDNVSARLVLGDTDNYVDIAADQVTISRGRRPHGVTNVMRTGEAGQLIIGHEDSAGESWVEVHRRVDDPIGGLLKMRDKSSDIHWLWVDDGGDLRILSDSASAPGSDTAGEILALEAGPLSYGGSSPLTLTDTDLALVDADNDQDVGIYFQRNGQRQWWLSTNGSPTRFTIGYGATATSNKVLEFGSGTQQIGLLGATPVGQQTSGANLTNNVTVGGTNDTIDNWTDLTTYATDSAAIRNAIYQLSRKLKQLNDGLRLFGLFT